MDKDVKGLIEKGGDRIYTLTIIILAALAFAFVMGGGLKGKEAHAVVIQVSAEGDQTLPGAANTPKSVTAPDLQLNVSQAYGDCNFFVNGEYTRENMFFPNSNESLRAGMQYNIAPNLVGESGVGSYKMDTFLYFKLTGTYDTKGTKQ